MSNLSGRYQFSAARWGVAVKPQRLAWQKAFEITVLRQSLLRDALPSGMVLQARRGHER